MQSYLTMGNKYGVKMKSVGGGMESFSVRKPDSSPDAYLSMSNAQLKMYGGGVFASIPLLYTTYKRQWKVLGILENLFYLLDDLSNKPFLLVMLKIFRYQGSYLGYLQGIIYSNRGLKWSEAKPIEFCHVFICRHFRIRTKVPIRQTNIE